MEREWMVFIEVRQVTFNVGIFHNNTMIMLRIVQSPVNGAS
jgi:hypothetical protein